MLYLPLSSFGTIGAIPSILARFFIGIASSGKIITPCKVKRYPLYDILFFIFHRRGIGVWGTIFPPKNYLHEVGVLYLLVFLIVVDSKGEFISPFFIENIDTSYNSFVVITVVKTLEPAGFFRKNSCVNIEIFSVYTIVIIGIILISIQFKRDIISKVLPIVSPISSSYNIHSSPKCICSESNRYNSFIDFYAIY